MTARIARAALGLAAACAVLLVAGTACSVQDAGAPPRSEAPAGLASPAPLRPEPGPLAPEPQAAAEPQVDPRGEPARVIIPAIDVDVDLVGLGLNTDGSMEVPDFGLAGWYIEGPKPGHAGPAVIAAHVDSRAGPDVFYRLRDLAAGDEIRVVYDGGDTVIFFADSSELTPKDELPVAAIWPTTNDRMLTLITCGGQFDRSERQYRDNLIVYTSAAEPQRAQRALG